MDIKKNSQENIIEKNSQYRVVAVVVLLPVKLICGVDGLNAQCLNAENQIL